MKPPCTGRIWQIWAVFAGEKLGIIMRSGLNCTGKAYVGMFSQHFSKLLLSTEDSVSFCTSMMPKGIHIF